MAKILISPSKYLQGAGEMKNLELMLQRAEKALVLISKGGYKKESVKRSKRALLRVPVRWFLIILTENAVTVRSSDKRS